MCDRCIVNVHDHESWAHVIGEVSNVIVCGV
jgi:hypothetical protein